MRKPIIRLFALALFALLFVSPRALAQEEASVVVHIRLHGVINPVKARYVKNAVERAREEGAALLLVSIDTPGGLVSSMQDIIGELTNCSIPVVGFVEPQSAQATSAGALILLATDVAAMAPATRMGAAHPVAADRNLEGAMDEKATNSMAALAKSLAKRRGHSEAHAEAIVRESKSFTAEEALENDIVDLVAADVDALLAKLDGRPLDFPDKQRKLTTKGAPRLELPMSWANRFVDTIADPTLAAILLTLGVLGILYELASPGIGMAGIVGATSLLVGLLAMSVLPLEFAGFALLAVGFVAIAIEVKAQTHGLLAIGGIAAVVIGALILVDEGSYFGGVQVVDWRLFVPFAACLTAGFVLLARVALRALGTRMQSGVEAMPGKRGTVKTPLAPAGAVFEGTVFVDGARWKAVADAEIGAGERIEVVEVLTHPARLKVKRVEQGGA